MIALVHPAKMVATAAALPVVASVAVSEEHLRVVVELAAFAAGVAAVIAWIDARIEKRGKVNAEAIAALSKKIDKLSAAVHHVKENGCARACPPGKTPAPIAESETDDDY